MSDIEKNRAEYVALIEQRLEHATTELAKYKEIAARWEPSFTVAVSTDGKDTTFGLRFGGKNVHATVPSTQLASTDLTTATSAIVDALVESLVIDRFKEVIKADVARAQQNAISVSGAGKW